MAKTIQVKFRPPKKEARGVAARVYVSQDNLLYLTGSLENGRPCVVEGGGGGGGGGKGGGGSDAVPVKREATLWLDRALTGVPDTSSPSPVKTTEAFQDACGFSLSQTYRITVSGETVPDADEIVLEDVSGDSVRPLAGLKETLSWTAALEGQIGRMTIPPIPRMWSRCPLTAFRRFSPSRPGLSGHCVQGSIPLWP